MARQTKAEVEQERDALRADLTTVLTAIKDEAESREWCEEYEAFIANRIEGRLQTKDVSVPQRFREVERALDLTFTFTIRGLWWAANTNLSDTDEVNEAVVKDFLAEHLDIDDGIDGLRRLIDEEGAMPAVTYTITAHE